MPIEYDQMKEINFAPKKTTKVAMFAIKYFLISLIFFLVVDLEFHKTFFHISVSWRNIIFVGVGFVIGILLSISEGLVKSFLLKRRLKKRGMFLCKNCGGAGWTPLRTGSWWSRHPRSRRREIQARCEICHGVGYIDWVQNVTRRGLSGNTGNNGRSSEGMSRSV